MATVAPSSATGNEARATRSGGRWEMRRQAAAESSATPKEAPAAPIAPPAQIPEFEHVHRRVLLVGNSQTYQPKELGGLPGALAKLALGILGERWQCEELAIGGADPHTLWEDFEATLRQPTARFDIFVLQVGRGTPIESVNFSRRECYRLCYGPLLGERFPNSKVILTPSWTNPDEHELSQEVVAKREVLDSYREALWEGSGCKLDIAFAPVADAFGLMASGVSQGEERLLRPSADLERLYAALFKDDMGHPSAFAGPLIALLVLLAIVGDVEKVLSASKRPLSKVMEALVPSSFRTASPGWAGKADISQKGWLDGKNTVPAGLIDHDDEDLGPLSKYPPGTRTEKRSLGLDAFDVLERVACILARREQERAGAGPCAREEEAAAIPASSAPAGATAKASRRWKAR